MIRVHYLVELCLCQYLKQFKCDLRLIPHAYHEQDGFHLVPVMVECCYHLTYRLMQ